MTSWQVTVFGALASGAVGLLYAIFQEVRSIRRMMNRDRNIEPD